MPSGPCRIEPVSRRLEFDVAYNYGRGFKTGRRIHERLKLLNDCGLGYDVILLPGTADEGRMMARQDFSNLTDVLVKTYTDNFKGSNNVERPVVLWNPAYLMEYLGDMCGVRVLNNFGKDLYRSINKNCCFWSLSTGPKKEEQPHIIAQSAWLPSWVVLYHELGHVLQYYSEILDIGVPAGVDLEKLTKDRFNACDTAWQGRVRNLAKLEQENLDLNERPLCSSFHEKLHNN